MNESVKNCIKRCDIDLKNALKMAVSTPARLMKLTDKLVKINGNPIDKLIYMDLDSFGKVDISTYDYENGEAKFTSYKLDDIKEWGKKNKDRIIINYSKVR